MQSILITARNQNPANAVITYSKAKVKKSMQTRNGLIIIPPQISFFHRMSTLSSVDQGILHFRNARRRTMM
jgi:hypothetical protein